MSNTYSAYTAAIKQRQKLESLLEGLKTQRDTIDKAILDTSITLMSFDRMIEVLVPHLEDIPDKKDEQMEIETNEA